MKIKICPKCGGRNHEKSTRCYKCKLRLEGQSLIVSIGSAFISLCVIAVVIGPWVTKKMEISNAKAAGFSTAEEYRRSREQGFSTKAELLAHQRAIKAAAEKRRQEELRQREEDKKKREQECLADFDCFANSLTLHATIGCRPLIEAQARIDYQWIDGFFEPKLSSYRKGPGPNQITYLGDKIRIQLPNGSWMRHSYRCVFDTNTKKAISANLSPGKN